MSENQENEVKTRAPAVWIINIILAATWTITLAWWWSGTNIKPGESIIVVFAIGLYILVLAAQGLVNLIIYFTVRKSDPTAGKVHLIWVFLGFLLMGVCFALVLRPF